MPKTYPIRCREWNYSSKKECVGTLVPRTGKYGNFYGCTNYPTCKHTWKFERGEWYNRCGEDPDGNADYATAYMAFQAEWEDEPH